MLVEGDAAALERALARESALWEAYKNRDIAALERLIDPLALDVGPGGAIGRDCMAGAVLEMEIRAYRLDPISVRVGGRMEILVTLGTVEGTYRGVPFEHTRVISSSTWVETHGGWRLVHRHESPSSR
jgi:hypothetical protein